MLIKVLTNSFAKQASLEEYREIVKKRRMLLLLCAAVGLLIVAIGVGVIPQVCAGMERVDFLSGLLAGMGSGIGGACLALWAVLGSRLRDEQALKQARLEELDERNQLVLLKNRSRAFQIHRYSCLALAALFFLLAAVQGTQIFLYVGIGFALAFGISLLVDIATFVYYECRT